MSDLINRAAAIDAVHRNYDTILDFRSDGETVANSVGDILSDLPSAQPVAKDINVPVKDCISRQAALDALGECQMIWTDDNDYVLGARNQYDMDRLAIETVPTIDAVPVVHGRWQYHINANNEVNPEDAYCSKCGFYVDVTTTFNFNKYLHCPYCGTRMDWKDGDGND